MCSAKVGGWFKLTNPCLKLLLVVVLGSVAFGDTAKERLDQWKSLDDITDVELRDAASWRNRRVAAIMAMLGKDQDPFPAAGENPSSNTDWAADVKAENHTLLKVLGLLKNPDKKRHSLTDIKHILITMAEAMNEIHIACKPNDENNDENRIAEIAEANFQETLDKKTADWEKQIDEYKQEVLKLRAALNKKVDKKMIDTFQENIDELKSRTYVSKEELDSFKKKVNLNSQSIAVQKKTIEKHQRDLERYTETQFRMIEEAKMQAIKRSASLLIQKQTDISEFLNKNLTPVLCNIKNFGKLLNLRIGNKPLKPADVKAYLDSELTKHILSHPRYCRKCGVQTHMKENNHNICDCCEAGKTCGEEGVPGAPTAPPLPSAIAPSWTPEGM